MDKAREQPEGEVDASQTRQESKLLRDELVAPTFRVWVDRGNVVTVGPLSPRVYVGKSAACDLVIADSSVSRRHAALELVPPFLDIVDLGSTNGTHVNGVRVEKARLRGGESVRVGDTTIGVELFDQSTKVRPHPTDRFGRVLGKSLAMRRLFPLLQKLSSSDVPAIIEGETGTGKELVAESIHEMGERKDAPFVVCDCERADPKELELVLFGAEPLHPGAPARLGLFEEAVGGTLLLDGIAELHPQIQARLLRTVERRAICRVRGDRWLPVDVRILVTTQRDLEREVELGRFREDLFHRINVGRVYLPPLRQRDGDVELLAAHFWSAISRESLPMPPDLLARQQGYGWPGNVRELQSVVVRRVELGEGEHGAAAGAARAAQDYRVLESLVDTSLPLPQARDRIVSAFERSYLARMLEMHGGNVSRAATAAGIARRYFYVVKNRSR